MSERENGFPECVECLELVELIGEYLDGEITSERQQELMAHVHSCDECARLVHSLRRLLSCCHGETSAEVPVTVHREFWQVIVKEIRVQRELPEA